MNQISYFSCFSNCETLNLHQNSQFTEFILNSDFLSVSNKTFCSSIFSNFNTVACVAIQSLLMTKYNEKQRTFFEVRGNARLRYANGA